MTTLAVNCPCSSSDAVRRPINDHLKDFSFLFMKPILSNLGDRSRKGLINAFASVVLQLDLKLSGARIQAAVSSLNCNIMPIRLGRVCSSGEPFRLVCAAAHQCVAPDLSGLICFGLAGIGARDTGSNMCDVWGYGCACDARCGGRCACHPRCGEQATKPMRCWRRCKVLKGSQGLGIYNLSRT